MATKSLGRAEDIKSTDEHMESGGQNFFLKIPDAKTPWYLLCLDYENYHAHWYENNGLRRPIVCAGGWEGNGFDPDNCPICAHVLSLYEAAKEYATDGDSDKANRIKKIANELRAKPSVVLKAVRGQMMLVPSTKSEIAAGAKKKKRVADFDVDDDESDVEVGILNLSKAQWEGLKGLIGGESTPFIESGEDLGNRVLYTKKERRKGKTQSYSAVVWSADEKESDFPDVEIPKEVEEIDLEEYGKVDMDEVNKVVQVLTGESIEDIEDDEAVDLEEDSDDSEVTDDYLDDVEDDEEDAPDDDDEDEDDEPEEEDDDDDEAPDTEAEFIDDDPDDLPPKKPKGANTRSRSASSKTSSKKTTASKAKGSTSKSKGTTTRGKTTRRRSGKTSV